MIYGIRYRYILIASVVVFAALAAVLILVPGLGGRTPPPETVGDDIVHVGQGLEQGDFDGTSIADVPRIGESITVAPEADAGEYVSEPVKTDHAFNALGLHWKAETPPGSRIDADLRFSQDGSEWTRWYAVNVDDPDLPDHFSDTSSAGETIGQLVFADEARYYQYRLRFSKNDQGDSPSISKLTASYIDAKGYGESVLSPGRIARQVGAVFSGSAAEAAPRVISRAQWGANEAYMKWTPEYRQVKKIIVHHTVTSNYDPDPAATVRSIYYYHAVSLGWGDIGYNFLIDRQGRIYEGRKGGNGVVGGHAMEWNYGSIGIAAIGDYGSNDITPEMYNSFVELMVWKSNVNAVNPKGNTYMLGSSLPNYLGHRDVGQTACPGNSLYSYLPRLRDAASPRYHALPMIRSRMPTGDTANNRPLISAEIFGSHINPASIVIKLDGVNVSAGSTRSATYVSYRPATPLAAGSHSVFVSVTDTMGATQTANWTFNVLANNYNPRDYSWTWYDNVSARNWVLMANPTSSGQNLYFDLYMAGRNMSLNQYALNSAGCPGFCGSGVAQPGQTLSPIYGGAMGGPLTAASLSGARAITSQRILWGENSFEEVPGFDAARLTDHYYWTWYDHRSAGFQNWILVGNQNPHPVYYEIRIAGRLMKSGTLQPGGNVTPTFPGVMGGPVEVRAWKNRSKSQPAAVMASQRVLSGGGDAFNEVTGIPAGELSSHYVWTWYDQQSHGAVNWVLVSNQNSFPVYFEVRIAGDLVHADWVEPGSNATPTFPGRIGGPVTVRAWRSPGGQPANVIATQRITWGPSFGETPGYPLSQLDSSYAWTWYDQKSAGALNWVLVGNPNGFPVYYEIRIGGSLANRGTVEPGSNATPTFPGRMGGPVEVQAWTADGRQAAKVMVSQRVLWNGYFNELLGTVAARRPGTPDVPAPSGGAGAATVTSNQSFRVENGAGALLTTLAAGQTASVSYSGGVYTVRTSSGYSHAGGSYIRIKPTGTGIMQVLSYNDVPSWNPSLNDNRFRGVIEVRYSPVSRSTWVINELPVEYYLRGIAESSSGLPMEFLKTMTVAARSYAVWHLDRGGKHGSNEIFHLKNSRHGNGDDQVYKGYGLEARFPELAAATNLTARQVVTYSGQVAMTAYYSNSDGRTRSAQEAWGVTYWPWLVSVPDPDCNGMAMNGHGVGLSGKGALARAQRGDGYATILAYYYRNTAIQAVNTNRNIRIAIAAAAP